MKIKLLFLITVAFALAFVAAGNFANSVTKHELLRVNGVNFVAPPEEFNIASLNSLSRINANWIAIIPYAYTRKSETGVIFFNEHPRWWGEGINGAIESIRMAKEKNLKVMLKPQVWVVGDGWPGDFLPENEAEWEQWENDYRKYALRCAVVCDSMQVDLFCIGTEYRKVVQKRPEFWVQLIDDIRSIYKGPLTYASNWDNYKNVTFWNKLDFIGIDAYFPLSKQKTPTFQALSDAWTAQTDEIKTYSNELNRKVIFTEYGYRSCDYSAHTHWDLPKEGKINLKAQSIAYRALYNAVWDKEWMAGGFLWKWFANDHSAGGSGDLNFTPQNKPAESVIKEWYSKN